MSVTLTGGFPIGFRRAPLSDWTQDTRELVAWARKNGFGALDLGADGTDGVETVVAADLRLGSVDLLEWRGMLSLDPARRRDAVAKNVAYVEAYAETSAGPLNFFTVMVPDDPSSPQRKVFGAMVESYTELAQVLEARGGRLVVEGWPGPSVLLCTPETCRAFFEACPSPALGLNYDPSHLIRMGVDPLRFLEEFIGRVYHVHAKDTELVDDARYLYGTQLPAVFAESPRFGGPFWRYTLPGHGVMRWKEAFTMLAAADYGGCVCIELEDHFFNGEREGEQRGLVASRQFLESC